MPQQGAVAIGQFKVINLVRALQLKICEVNVDDIALSNPDGLPFVKVVVVVRRVVGTLEKSTGWKAFWLLWQSTCNPEWLFCFNVSCVYMTASASSSSDLCLHDIVINGRAGITRSPASFLS